MSSHPYSRSAYGACEGPDSTHHHAPISEASLICPRISPRVARRHACFSARSNSAALFSQELVATVAYALDDKIRHSASGSVSTHSSPRAKPFTSSTSTSTPFVPVLIASSGQPVAVETTGVLHAIASIAGRLKPSLRLAVIHTSHCEYRFRI